MTTTTPFDLASAPADARAALDAYVLALADDALLQGHRDSEWTGLGPILEEDIAFSSMAQDEIGHALVWYTLRAEHLGAPTPDEQAFRRDAAGWRNARLVELPRGDYATSLIRRTLFDIAKAIQYDALRHSAWPPLAVAAGKLRQEKKYHLLHNQAYVRRLGTAGADSHDRLQSALDALFPAALGLFEPTAGEAALTALGVVTPSAALSAVWLGAVRALLAQSGLSAPIATVAAVGGEGDGAGAGAGAGDVLRTTVAPDVGGRRGEHTDDLGAMLDAMQSLHRSDPEATW
ncbi:MAG: phenylacetate-CoA oxygenase subunit PaaC [Ardenticatenales bacterium]|nr:phenylacetate-CoA oxygenase subunit PaaC [Ardenticatenales bacterium]